MRVVIPAGYSSLTISGRFWLVLNSRQWLPMIILAGFVWRLSLQHPVFDLAPVRAGIRYVFYFRYAFPFFVFVYDRRPRLSPFVKAAESWW